MKALASVGTCRANEIGLISLSIQKRWSPSSHGSRTMGEFKKKDDTEDLQECQEFG